MDGVPTVLRIEDHRSGTVGEIFEMRMCPRYARVSSSISPVILRLASSLHLRKAVLRERKCPLSRQRESASIFSWNSKERNLDDAFVAATRGVISESIDPDSKSLGELY